MSLIDLDFELGEKILEFPEKRKNRIIKKIDLIGDDIFQLIGNGTKENIEKEEVLFRKNINLEDIRNTLSNKENLKKEISIKLYYNIFDELLAKNINKILDISLFPANHIDFIINQFVLFFLIEPILNSFDTKSANSDLKVIFDKKNNDLIISILDDGKNSKFSNTLQKQNDGNTIGGEGIFISFIENKLNGKVSSNIDEGAIFLYRINIEKLRKHLLEELEIAKEKGHF